MCKKCVRAQEISVGRSLKSSRVLGIKIRGRHYLGPTISCKVESCMPPWEREPGHNASLFSLSGLPKSFPWIMEGQGGASKAPQPLYEVEERERTAREKRAHKGRQRPRLWGKVSLLHCLDPSEFFFFFLLSSHRGKWEFPWECQFVEGRC